MNPIEKLQTILKEMESSKDKYVANPQKDFSRNRKVTFYDLMWFLLFIGANSMSEEIRRAFNDKDFSYISEAATSKRRNKIKVSAFEQLLRKFNDTPEKAKKYKGYRVIAVDGSDFSSLYSAESEYATISNQYGGANRMHINFAYDILNKNFLDCVNRACFQGYKTRARCLAFPQQKGFVQCPGIFCSLDSLQLDQQNYLPYSFS